MQVGTGKSVLNGIAIGKLKIYKKKDTAISTAPVADTAAELERFEAARQKAIEQQTALYEKALAEAGEDIAEVFNIHAMMLDDDDFVDAIKEIINGQKMCAEYAVKTAGNNQAAVFAAMDDPYLQARSADVLDIAQAMLDILQGVDNASLQGTEPSILVAEDLAPVRDRPHGQEPAAGLYHPRGQLQQPHRHSGPQHEHPRPDPVQGHSGRLGRQDGGHRWLQRLRLR